MKLYRLINKQWVQFPYINGQYVPGFHITMTDDRDVIDARYDSDILVSCTRKENTYIFWRQGSKTLEAILLTKRLRKQCFKYFKYIIRHIDETL